MQAKHIYKLLLTTIAAILVGSASVSAMPERPQPPKLVNDLAGIFSAGQIMGLENTLVAFDDTTSNQIAVVTVNDLEGYDPAEYATRIGLDWGIGSAEFDNGVVLLLKPRTDTKGEIFIAVGYGLEGAIPDAYALRIIDNEMMPYLAEGQYYEAVVWACETLMMLASGEISEPRDDSDGELVGLIAMLIFIIFVIVICIIASKGNNGGNGNSGSGGGRRIYTGPVFNSDWGSSSGGSFGGGGFGGFGGFGGGSFGGGGAGRSF